MGKSVRNHIDALFSQPGQELGHWARFARYQVRLWRFCWRRLGEHNVAAMSAALSFRTIFAMIPVLLFAFLVLKSVGVVEDSKDSLRRFLDVSGFSQVVALENGRAGGDQAGSPERSVPSESAKPEGVAGGEVFSVADKIEEVFTAVEDKLTFRRLGPIGGALLIWTALTLLTTMEHSLNRVFGAPRGRSVARRVLLYWSVLTLGPVALAVAAYAGRAVTVAFQDVAGVGWLLVAMGQVGPVVVGVLVVAAIYKLLPNTRVRYRAAISGGVIAVPLWLLARWGFAIYVQRLVVKGNLYGVLGVLPLFLMWVNLSWLIFLFGAELAHTATNLRRMALLERAESAWLGPSDMLAVAVALARRFESGEGAVDVDDVADAVNLPGELVEKLLRRLESCGLICPVDGERDAYVPGQPVDAIAVADVLRAADPRGFPAPGDVDAVVATAVGAVHRDLMSAAGARTLGALVRVSPESADSE